MRSDQIWSPERSRGNVVVADSLLATNYQPFQQIWTSDPQLLTILELRLVLLILIIIIIFIIIKSKGKVVYGQEPHSGGSTTTECGFNYQLLAVITEVALGSS